MAIWHSFSATYFYIMGTFLNVFSLFICCRRNNWEKLNSMKFLIVVQNLSSLILIACCLAFEFLDFLPQRYCALLPTILVFILSFAWFNLAVLLAIKYTELTSIWSLRFNTAWMILFTELVVCAIVEFPFLYSSSKGSPIVFYDEELCPSCCAQTTKEQLPWGMKVNVISYSFWYIFIHFGIVGTLVFNRCIAIWMHNICYKEADDDQKQQKRCYNTTQHVMNALCIILVSVVFMLLSVRLQNNKETLNFLNQVLHTMISFSVAILCVPVQLFWGVMATGRSFHDMSEHKEMLSNKDDDMIIA